MPEDLDIGHAPLEAASPYELRVNLGTAVTDADVHEALATGDVGYLHSFTTGSTVDGPGVRVVAWTTGCSWRCVYCHNPDTWTIGNGMPVTIERAVDELRKYRHGLKVMGGGFTLSGGEPLMQHRFAVKLCRAAQQMGIHTAVQTNGHFGDKLSDSDLHAFDLVMLDLKTWAPEHHRRLTGMDNIGTRAFAERLAIKRRPVWLRFVLVPGVTDHAEDIKRIAGFAARLGNVERVEVLPFHQLGRYKWKALGLHYTLEQTEPPAEDAVEAVRGVFAAEGLTAN